MVDRQPRNVTCCLIYTTTIATNSDRHGDSTMTIAHHTILQDLGENVDRLCTLDFRPPGPTSGYIGRFYAAVREQVGMPLALTAAQCLQQVSPGSTVVIATGFCHPERLPQGETDGPPGAAVLARAVLQGLEATPWLLGEAAITAPLQACVQSVGLQLHPATLQTPPASPSVVFQAFPTDPQTAQIAAAQLIEQVRPAAVVVTEKVGPNRLGVAH